MELPLKSLPVEQLTADDRAIFDRFSPGTEFCCRLDDRADSLAMAAARADFGSVVDAVVWEHGGSSLVRPVSRLEGLKRLRRDLVQMPRAAESMTHKFELARAQGLL